MRYNNTISFMALSSSVVRLSSWETPIDVEAVHMATPPPPPIPTPPPAAPASIGTLSARSSLQSSEINFAHSVGPSPASTPSPSSEGLHDKMLLLRSNSELSVKIV